MDNLLTGLSYSIMDPTANITALVESDVDISRQPSVAAELMHRHPEVEQVGFVRLQGMKHRKQTTDRAETVQAEEQTMAGAETEDADKQTADYTENVHAELRMAGGEFCGNASMSTAALYLLRREEGEEKTAGDAREDPGSVWKEPEAVGKNTEPERVFLRVSGAEKPVEVRLWRDSKDSFRAGIRMPYAKEISRESFSFEKLCGTLPVVRMEGISHIIIEEDSVFFSLQEDRTAAGQAVRAWCKTLDAEGLGLMFLEEEEEGTRPEFTKTEPGFAKTELEFAKTDQRFRKLESAFMKTGSALTEPGAAGFEMRCTPLVYIPVSHTEFWENSCASGSSATGMYLAAKTGKAVSVRLKEPGGSLYVESDPWKKETWLYGKTRLIYSEPGGA